MYFHERSDARAIRVCQIITERMDHRCVLKPECRNIPLTLVNDSACSYHLQIDFTVSCRSHVRFGRSTITSCFTACFTNSLIKFLNLTKHITTRTLTCKKLETTSWQPQDLRLEALVTSPFWDTNAFLLDLPLALASVASSYLMKC